MSDAERLWRSKADDEVVEAAERLSDYTEEGERIIRAELRRRRLPEPPPPVAACPRCGRSIARNHSGAECSQCGEPFSREILGTLATPAAPIELVSVLVTGDAGLILLAKSLLEAEGIEYLLRSENLQDLFGIGRIGGNNVITGAAEFLVSADDAELAQAVLDQLEATPTEPTPRDDAPTPASERADPALSREVPESDATLTGVSRRHLFTELALVVAIIWVPLLASGVWYRAEPVPRSLASEVYGLVIEVGQLSLLLYLVRRNGEPLQVLGLRQTNWPLEMLAGFVIFFAAWIAAFGVDSIAARFDVLQPSSASSSEAIDGVHRRLLPAFLLVGAVFEEVFYRGYIWNRVEQLTGRSIVALLGSSVLFTLPHTYPLIGMIDVFVFGVLLGGFYWGGRSVPRLVLAHFSFNLAVFY